MSRRAAAILLLAAAGSLCAAGRAGCAAPVQTARRGRLVWSDEFKGPAGSAPKAAIWSFDDGLTYNHELETYVSDPKNCHLVRDPAATDGSALAIVATDEGGGKYHSARLVSSGKYSFKYGYVEARCKLPAGQGLWPAFWMMGTRKGWPFGGEIDVMENIGKEPGTNHGSLHGPDKPNQPSSDYSAYNVTRQIATASGQPLSAAYHTYALSWQPGKLTFYFDGKPYATDTPATLPPGSQWTYDDEPCYFILNTAVGGDWPGSPDSTTRLPQTLLVDYIRVYAR